MGIRAFSRGNIYKHRNPHASLYLVVLAVHHQNEHRAKMKIQYMHKNGRIQYTGKGKDQHSEQIRIPTNQFKDWTCIGNVNHVPQINENLIPQEEPDQRNWDELLKEE